MLNNRRQWIMHWGVRIAAFCFALLLFPEIAFLGIASNVYASPRPRSAYVLAGATSPVTTPGTVTPTVTVTPPTPPTSTATTPATVTPSPTVIVTPTPQPTPRPHKHKATPTPQPTKAVQAVQPPPPVQTPTANIAPTPTPPPPSPTPTVLPTATAMSSDSTMSGPMDTADVQQQAANADRSNNRTKILVLEGTSALTVLGAGSLLVIGMRRKKLKQHLNGAAQGAAMDALLPDVAYTSVEPYAEPAQSGKSISAALPTTPAFPMLPVHSYGDPYATTPFIPSGAEQSLPAPEMPAAEAQSNPSLDLEAMMQQAQMGLFALPSANDQAEASENA